MPFLTPTDSYFADRDTIEIFTILRRPDANFNPYRRGLRACALREVQKPPAMSSGRVRSVCEPMALLASYFRLEKTDAWDYSPNAFRYHSIVCSTPSRNETLGV